MRIKIQNQTALRREERWGTMGEKDTMATKQHLSKETSQDGLHFT